jgi:hypothetical protein
MFNRLKFRDDFVDLEGKCANARGYCVPAVKTRDLQTLPLARGLSYQMDEHVPIEKTDRYEHLLILSARPSFP